MKCRCGCEKEVKLGNKFIHGHNRTVHYPVVLPQLCGCGCGKETEISRDSNKPNRFIVGHSGRGRPGFWLRKSRPDISLRMFGKKIEYKEHLGQSQAMKEIWADPIEREYYRTGSKRAMNRPEIRKSIGMKSKGFWDDPVEYVFRSSLVRGEKNPMFGKHPVYPIPWVVSELNHKVRSTLERDFFLFLKRNNVSYEYEVPFLLILSDGSKRNYFVDGRLVDKMICIECKGYCDEYSKLKMKLFREQYPQYKLYVVTYKNSIQDVPIHCFDEIYAIEDLDKMYVDLR
jgi:hypothetical protein